MKSFKTRGLTLLIEHSPCCILSFAAGLVGISFLNHNPMLELGFALGGAVVGERIGHHIFHKGEHHHHGWKDTARRYGLSLMFGLASWGVHQQFLHNDHHHAHNGAAQTTYIAAQPEKTDQPAIKPATLRG